MIKNRGAKSPMSPSKSGIEEVGSVLIVSFLPYYLCCVPREISKMSAVTSMMQRMGFTRR